MFRWGSKAIARWKVPQFKRALVSAVRPDRSAKIPPGAPDPAPGATTTTHPRPVTVAGTQGHWLRVLSADDLMAYLNAGGALNAIWHQSHLAEVVWQRDLLAAIRRYAEFVQLMPASESHHHAHAGGLLAHTLEMTLAAATWRNGHLLPPGAAIEQMDAEHDAWTYVVFFAALLHDIAKPMTDLRVHWKAGQMTEALRWTPVAGSLVQITRGRANPEYLVEFTPKVQRDYTAHSRLAITLLTQIAPAPALTLLARTPAAMEALERFLSGRDKESVIAQIVARADRASTERALLAGSRARFATAASVPLVELLMGAMRAMLQGGTELPLNRSGAAGWVHEGAVWFVAKRLADAVRAWIQAHEPSEGVPGENKNDRLFDTWQEYGCIETNPATGHAVWYVTVEGAGTEPGAAYTHQLTVLKFPLGKLFEDAAAYPSEMAGRIVVRQKPAAKDKERAEDGGTQAEQESAGPAEGQRPEAASETATRAQETGAKPSGKSPTPAGGPVRVALRAPTFNKPKAARAVAQEAGASTRANKPAKTQANDRAVPQLAGADDDGLLGDEEDAKAALQAFRAERKAARADAATQKAAPSDEPEREPVPPTAHTTPEPLLTSTPGYLPEPVVLRCKLPKLPKGAAKGRHAEPSATAIAFMAWLQRGLASGEITYNETSAPVHFVEEGMALVSPLIFKEYAEAAGLQDADAGLAVQRDVLHAGWHRVAQTERQGRLNVLRYDVLKGSAPVGTLAAVVIAEPGRWVTPLPPANPFLRLA